MFVGKAGFHCNHWKAKRYHLTSLVTHTVSPNHIHLHQISLLPELTET